MATKVTAEELKHSINNEGIGYAILNYYGRDIKCVDDKEAEKLWKKAYTSLKKLEIYLENIDNEM